MKKKFLIIIFALACVVSLSFGLAACGDTTGGKTEGEMYTVRFDAGRGTIFGERIFETKVNKNSTVEEPNQEPVCDGYVFIGWNTTSSENDAMWKFNTDIVERDITLYAVWLQAYEVTFDANGGKFDNGTEIYKVNVVINSKLTTVPNVTAPDDNHALGGWSEKYGGEIDVAEYTVTRDITLTARWELSDAVQTALEPFTYSERYGMITVTGVKDKEAETSLTVPSIVSYIADNAFKDCINLETVVIDDNISSIGVRAFSGCEKLTTVTLPSGLKEIKDYTFDGCASLEAIDIPDTLTTLGVAAFYNCSSLTSVELPVGITKIAGSTFRGCSSLEEIKVAAGVTEIGAYAFMDCAALEEFEIPSGVKTLQSYVFSGCSSLQSITIPTTCTRIYQYAFENSGLVTAVIHAQKVDFRAFEYCALLENLTIGTEVEEIGQDAFNGCASLIEVEIPDNVTAMSSQVFNDCTSLKSVTIGMGLTEIPSGTFSGCSQLREVKFGSNITSIKGSAFADCISLLSFTIPSTVTSIDSKAFTGCNRLVEIYNLTEKSITKPMSDTVIHTSADDESIIHTVNGFSFCTFKDLIYPYAEGMFLLDYTGNAENLVLPADYEGNSYKIFRYALAFNPQLKSVTLSAGVEAIRDEILLGSDNVTTLSVASGNTVFSVNNNCVIDVANKKFVLGCKTSVIPTDGSVTAIGSNVFCHNKTIVNETFRIPASVTVVESDAFAGMDGIIRIAENGIKYVDKWAVGYQHNGLATRADLEIDAGTVGIADSAFAANIDTNGRWINSVKTNAELKYIGDSAFSFCDFITEITLNNGLVSIGSGAFGACSRLKEIVIPDTVTYMGASVFSNCWDLEYVKLSSGLSVIKYQMFRGCEALKSVVIPTSVVEIEYAVFSSSTSTSAAVNPTIYYGGDSAQWNAIKKPSIGSDADKLQSLKKVYYSETAPSSGTAWHYGADGKPTTQY